MSINLPNIITIIRIVLIPIFVLAFYSFGKIGHVFATGIFILAGVSDWLDGYLARTLCQTSRFGEFLDPVADKLIVSIALVLIVGELGATYITIPAAVILGREIVVSALREWMAEIGKRTSVAVSYIGKVKTTAQMVSLGLLLLYYPPHKVYYLISGVLLLYVAAALTLWSMFMYLKAAWYDLTLTVEK